MGTHHLSVGDCCHLWVGGSSLSLGIVICRLCSWALCGCCLQAPGCCLWAVELAHVHCTLFMSGGLIFEQVVGRQVVGLGCSFLVQLWCVTVSKIKGDKMGEVLTPIVNLNNNNEWLSLFIVWLPCRWEQCGTWKPMGPTFSVGDMALPQHSCCGHWARGQMEVKSGDGDDEAMVVLNRGWRWVWLSWMVARWWWWEKSVVDVDDTKLSVSICRCSKFGILFEIVWLVCIA